MKPPQIIYDLDEKLYHADLIAEGGDKQGCVSRSEISDFFRFSPRYLKHKRDGLLKTKESPSLEFGSLFHATLLQVDKPTFQIIPDNITSKRGKEWDRFKSDCDTQNVIPAWKDDIMHIQAMVESVRAHEIAIPDPLDREVSVIRIADMLDHRGSQFEVSGYADHFAGVRRRCRWDCLPAGSNVILDFKTVGPGGASPEAFSRSIAQWEYHIQAAWYIDVALDCGLDRSLFWFVVVEKEAPFATAVYQLDREDVMIARKEYERRLGLYRDCVDKNEWPGYSQKVETIKLPPWANRGFGELEGGH